MSLVDRLKEKFGTPAQEWGNQWDELHEQFLEMSQLKSNFDMEKFTVASQGPHLAHQFHFLMRQYSLALHEVRRITLDREERLRQIEELEDGVIENGKYPDIEIMRHKNEIDLLELTLANKVAMCEYMEKLRQVLIAKNGGEFTNEQYQEEVPQYWKWFLTNKAKQQQLQAQTGVHEGTWQNIQLLEEPAPITPEFQLRMVQLIEDKG
jgi:hypothetical protein